MVTLGPLRFNSDQDAESFRDWVQARHGVDARESDDWEIQAFFDEYTSRHERAAFQAEYDAASPEERLRVTDPAAARAQYRDEMRDAGRAHLLREEDYE